MHSQVVQGLKAGRVQARDELASPYRERRDRGGKVNSAVSSAWNGMGMFRYPFPLLHSDVHFDLLITAPPDIEASTVAAATPRRPRGASIMGCDRTARQTRRVRHQRRPRAGPEQHSSPTLYLSAAAAGLYLSHRAPFVCGHARHVRKRKVRYNKVQPDPASA